MKFVKLSIFALSLGLFVASCGNSESTETPAVDSAAMTTPEVAPEAPATTDSQATTAPVTTDSQATTAPATTAPAAH